MWLKCVCGGDYWLYRPLLKLQLSRQISNVINLTHQTEWYGDGYKLEIIAFILRFTLLQQQKKSQRNSYKKLKENFSKE